MIDTEKAARILEQHEGNRRYAYTDSVGKLTIGIGFNLDDVGLYPEESQWILRNRISKIDTKLINILPEYRGLNAVRRIVLVDMMYNLGQRRFFGFKKMLAALQVRDYAEAAKEMLDSKWARQVGGRSTRLARIMETGEWYED